MITNENTKAQITKGIRNGRNISTYPHASTADNTVRETNIIDLLILQEIVIDSQSFFNHEKLFSLNAGLAIFFS